MDLGGNLKSVFIFAEKSLKLARSVAERLVQRLVCGIGQLDSRFASKFLVSLNEKEDEVIIIRHYNFNKNFFN